jgi:hypothetical protein
MYFVRFSDKIGNISLNVFNRLVAITEMECGSCEVWTDFINIIHELFASKVSLYNSILWHMYVYGGI